MPPLRERLKSPLPYLAVLGIGFLLLTVDVTRAPERQLSADLYQLAVRSYQQIGRPLLDGRVRCRYRPSCSEYSRQAVERHGIVRGVLLTASRLASCRRHVPLGTADPVPARADRPRRPGERR